MNVEKIVATLTDTDLMRIVNAANRDRSRWRLRKIGVPMWAELRREIESRLRAAHTEGPATAEWPDWTFASQRVTVDHPDYGRR